MPVLRRKSRTRSVQRHGCDKGSKTTAKATKERKRVRCQSHFEIWGPCSDEILRRNQSHGEREPKDKLKHTLLRKLKAVVKKGKTKFCKSCKRFEKTCVCKLDATVLVLKDFLKHPCGNLNQSAIGHNDARRLPIKSKSCTDTSDVPTLQCRDVESAPKMEKYLKYIPVNRSWGHIYPCTLAGEFRQIWLDLQIWYSNWHDAIMNRKSNGKLIQSKSESDLSKEVPKVRASSDGKPIEKDCYSLCRQRFDYESNIDYLALVKWHGVTDRVDCKFDLYVSQAEDDDILHIKTDMIHSCMRSFVQQNGDCQIMWVSDIQKLFPPTLKVVYCCCIEPDVIPKLVVQLRRAKAVLLVNWPASILLRHQGLAFLDTLAAAVDIERRQLVVLPHLLTPPGLKDMTSSRGRSESRKENSSVRPKDHTSLNHSTQASSKTEEHTVNKDPSINPKNIDQQDCSTKTEDHSMVGKTENMGLGRKHHVNKIRSQVMENQTPSVRPKTLKDTKETKISSHLEENVNRQEENSRGQGKEKKTTATVENNSPATRPYGEREDKPFSVRPKSASHSKKNRRQSSKSKHGVSKPILKSSF